MSDVFISIDRAESDLLDCAAYLAERIKSPDGHGEAMNSIVPMYLQKGNVDLAAELANAIDDPHSRDKLLIAVAVKCAEIDDEEYGLQLAEAIEDQALQAQAYERIGLAMAERGRAEAATDVADRMGHPDFVYAGIAVSKVVQGSDAAADEMLESIEFPAAKVNALQQIASVQMNGGSSEKAVAALLDAVEATEDIEHDEERIRLLCELGNTFVDAKVNDKAIETFDKASKLAEALDNRHRDAFLVATALGFLNAGSVDLADRTLDLVTDKTQMASGLLGFARDHWGKDEKEDAVEALEEAYAILLSQRENETRDTRARNALFTTIAAQFAGFGKTKRATEIAMANPDPDGEMKALTQIAQILTVQKEDVLARDTVNMIAEDSNRLFALVGIADALRKQERTEAALETLDEAATLAETVPQLSARSEVLNEIAERFVAFGEREKARSIGIENLRVIAQIRDESSRAASIAHLAATYDKADLKPGEEELSVIRKLANEILF